MLEEGTLNSDFHFAHEELERQRQLTLFQVTKYKRKAFA